MVVRTTDLDKLPRILAAYGGESIDLGMRILAIRKVDLNAEFGFDSADTSESGGASQDSAGTGGGIQVEPGQERISVVVAVVYDIGT